MSLFDPGIIAALDSDGVTISGATWSFYLTGTSTPQAVYSNSTLLTSVGSTITADSAGRWSPVFLDDTKLYRAIQKDAGGTTLFDIDPLNDGFNGLTSRISTAETNITALQTQITTVSGSANRNGLLNGGQVVWETGYTFRVSAASYYINGTLYTSLEQTVTLTAADGTNPRIDVIYLDSSGIVGNQTGTAAVNPSEPDIDAGTQLKLTFVYVPAASAAPVGVSNENIYLENTEWTSSVSGTGFNAAGVTNPYAGTKCIDGTAVAAAAYVQLQRGSSITLESYAVLAMFVRSKATWTAGRVLRAQFYASGVAKGVPVTIGPGYWGFDSSITSGYQQVAIPLSQFVIPAGTSINQLRITDSGGSIGFYIDNIVLQTQGTALSQGGTGLTQDLADARYFQLTAAATTTEALTGTSTSKVVTPDALAALWEQGSDVASAATVSLGEGGYFNITGTTTITDIDFATDKAGRRAWVKFAGALTMTHNASTLILPGGASITTAAGDCAEFVSEGADAVRCVSYTKANGQAVVGGSGYTDEQVRDVIGAALVAGSNVTITVNDAGDTITIAGTGGGGTGWGPELDAPSTSVFSLSNLGTGATLGTAHSASKGLSVRRTDTGPGAGLDNMAFIGKLVPSGSSWTAEMGIRLGYRIGNNYRVGLCLLENSGGKSISIVVAYGAGGTIGIFAMSSTNLNGGMSSISSITPLQLPEFIRVKVDYNGTNYVFSWSMDDGLNYVVLATLAKATYFTSAADRIGFCVHANGAFTANMLGATVIYYNDPDY